MRAIKSAIKREARSTIVHPAINISAGFYDARAFFGLSLRQPELVHILGLSFQIVAIVGFSFAFWFWLIKVYKASSVESFSFLSPVFSVVFGWVVLGEALNATVMLSLGLITIGLILVNRP